MPNRGAHVVTAGVAGLNAADHGRAVDGHPINRPANLLCGKDVVGAVWRGIAPNRIEPPDHPRLRDRAHSLLVRFLLAALLAVFAQLEMKLLDVARSEEVEAGGPNLKAITYSCLAGVGRGFAVGYLSHLGADEMAQGEVLPLISRSVG